MYDTEPKRRERMDTANTATSIFDVICMNAIPTSRTNFILFLTYGGYSENIKPSINGNLDRFLTISTATEKEGSS